MKLKLIVLIFFFVIKVFCSGQNHTPTDFVIQILAAADENCVHKSKCRPRLDPETGKPYIFNIRDNNENNRSSNNLIDVSIYDIIPELRFLSEKDAIKYYENVLFPAAKRAFNEYFELENFDDLNDFDDMSENEKLLIQNIIIEKINDVTNGRDVIRELLSSSGNNENIAFINDGKSKTINYYGDDKNTNLFHEAFIDYMNNRITKVENVLNKFKVDKNKISKNVIKAIFTTCKQRITCNHYFENVDANKVKFTIIKSETDNNEKNYHLVINDQNNERLIHPFTIKESYSDGKQKLTINTNFIHKEIPFYNKINYSDNNIKNSINNMIENRINNIMNEANTRYSYIKNGYQKNTSFMLDIGSYFSNINDQEVLDRIRNRLYEMLHNYINSNNDQGVSNYSIQILTNKVMEKILNIAENGVFNEEEYKNKIRNFLEEDINIVNDNLVNELINNLNSETVSVNGKNISVLEFMNNLNHDRNNGYNYNAININSEILLSEKLNQIVDNTLTSNGLGNIENRNEKINRISKKIYEENFIMNKKIEYSDSKFIKSIKDALDGHNNNVNNAQLAERIFNEFKRDVYSDRDGNLLIDTLNSDSRNNNNNLLSIYQVRVKRAINAVLGLDNNSNEYNNVAQNIINSNKKLNSPNNNDFIVKSILNNLFIKDYENLNQINNSFDLSIIERTLIDENMNDDDINKLKKMLDNNIDINEEYKNQIVNRMKNHEPITNNGNDRPLRNAIINILDRKCFYQDLNINLFDMNLIKRTLIDRNMNDDDIKKLKKMLDNYIDINEEYKDQIVERMRQHKPITNNGNDKPLRNAITNILNHKCFNQLFNENINSISFATNDNDGNTKTLHSITNCFNKNINNPNNSGNNGYLEDYEYDVMVKSGAIFSKVSAGKDQDLYIPQENDIDLGNRVHFNAIGYCYKNSETDEILIDKTKLNNNIVGKYLYNKDECSNSLENFLNSLIDTQKNENLNEQLNELYITLINNENYFNPDGSKFNDPNHWRNTMLLYNMVDLYEKSCKNYQSMQSLYKRLKNYDGMDQKELAEKLANLYTVQQLSNNKNGNIKKGLKLDDITYSDLQNKIEIALNEPYEENNKKFLKDITNRLREDLKKTESTIKTANKLINFVEKNDYDVNEQRSYLKQKNVDNSIIKSFNNLKNTFNNKFPKLDFYDNVLWKDSNKNLKTTESISSDLLNTINDERRESDIRNKEINVQMVKGMNEKGLQQRLYAINRDGSAIGYSIEKDHLVRIKNQMGLYENVVSNANRGSSGNCQFHKISKRASSGNSCHTVPKIITNVDVDKISLETLKSFKDKGIDHKIFPNYNSVSDISNPKNLYENSESIADVWKKLTNTYYEHIHEFSESESEVFLANFNIVINEYKNMLSDSDYVNDPLNKNITPEMVSSMETDLTRSYNYHYEHFGEESDNSLRRYRMDYNKNSQSKLNREKFIHTLNSIKRIVSQNEGNPIDSIGTKIDGNSMSSEIDPNSIVFDSVDIKEAVEKLIKKIPSLDETYNDDLINIYDNLSELHSINEMEYGLNQNTSVNSEIVHRLYNAISEKLAIENSFSKNVKQSENIVKVPGLEPAENVNILDAIKDNSISADDKKFILKGMEHQINNSPSKYLDNKLYKLINNINTHINNQIDELKKFSSHIGHELATLNIVSLSSAYNDLAATAIYNNKIYSNDINNNSPINIIEFDNEFNNRVNFVMNRQFNEAMLTIAKANPSLYNSDIKINSGNKFIWGGNTVYEASNTVLSKFNKDGTSFTSKAEFVSQLINNADDSTYRILQQSYSLKYNYVNYQSPASRDQNHINELEHNYNKLRFKHVQKNIQSIDTYHSSQFFSALSVVASYNPNLTPLATEDDNKNIVNVRTMYKGASNYKEMFTAMNEFETNLKNSNQLTDDIKSKINNAANKFTSDIQITSYKLAKMAGRENQNTFSTFTNEFSIVTKCVSGYINNNAQLFNNERGVPQFKYNQNTLNVVHNHNLINNNINKNNKELRISHNKSITKTTGKK